ncbi:MAG: type II toxin-antitoxin system YhaV family toxin [Syntrophobacteraceae bacterium]|jgi:toxin YhaV
MKINDWNIYFFILFQRLLDELEKDVSFLKENDPEGFRSHPKFKLLAGLFKCITEYVPANPNNPRFLLGNTLGTKYNNWRRVKELLPPRYRLFFQFRSDLRDIIFAWFNDENTLRKEGSSTDVYAVFRKMLENEIMPSDFSALKKSSHVAP